MKPNCLLSFVIGGVILLTSYTAAVQFGFGEVDYSENESTGKARVVLIKLDENTEPISLTVSSMTFDEYFESGRTLTPEFDYPSAKAQYNPSGSGRRDFEKVSETVTFPPSNGIQEQEVFIPFVDDTINEATEGFIVLAELSEGTNQESQDEVSFIRGGVTVVNIVDDDPIKVGFEKTEYSVSEDDGTIEDTVYITKGDTETEVDISVVIENSINGVAQEGADYNFIDPLVIVLHPEDDRIPIPVTLLQDNIAEDREQFQLFLALNQPIRGQSPGVSTTTLIIEDDDIAVVNFTQPEYVVNEGDGSVEVCIQIAEPEEFDLFLYGSVTSEEGDATVDDDFNGVNEFFDLYDGKREHCFEVPIIDDPEKEPNETLVLQLQPDTSFLPPNVQFPMTNVIITIVDNDQPEQLLQVEPTVQEVVSTEQEVKPTEPEVVLVDECALNTHKCSQYAQCVDTADGYECNCLPGFTGDGHTCLDINECCEELDDCDSNAKCQNTIGSYTCACRPGFTGNGRTCRDIDECADSKANTCSSNAHCFNVPGYHFCVCKAGFTGNGKECAQIVNEPVDECSRCHRKATCEKGPNGNRCVCNNGFSGDGRRCRDINECDSAATPVCPSVAKCRNRYGSFTCTCPRGYKKASGNRCVEIGRSPQLDSPEAENTSTRSTSRGRSTRSRTHTRTSTNRVHTRRTTRSQRG